MSIAKTIAGHCDNAHLYYTATDRGDSWHVRIYGWSQGGVTAVWQLLTDAELTEIGQQWGVPLTSHRFQPGGIIVPKDGKVTCYALAVGVWRFLGKTWNQATLL